MRPFEGEPQPLLAGAEPIGDGLRGIGSGVGDKRNPRDMRRLFEGLSQAGYFPDPGRRSRGGSALQDAAGGCGQRLDRPGDAPAEEPGQTGRHSDRRERERGPRQQQATPCGIDGGRGGGNADDPGRAAQPPEGGDKLRRRRRDDGRPDQHAGILAHDRPCVLVGKRFAEIGIGILAPRNELVILVGETGHPARREFLPGEDRRQHLGLEAHREDEGHTVAALDRHVDGDEPTLRRLPEVKPDGL